MTTTPPDSIVDGYLVVVALLWLCAHYWMKRAKALQKQNDAQHVEILKLRWALKERDQKEGGVR